MMTSITGFPPSTFHLSTFDLEALNAAISRTMQEETLKYFIICDAYQSAEQQNTENDYTIKQQVLIHHPLHRQMADFLNKFGQLELELLIESTKFSIWQQGNVMTGRKQLQPIVARFLSSE